MTVDPRVLAARARLTAAKVRLDGSLAQAKSRLSPKALAVDAVEGARDRAVDAASAGLQVARDRPAATAAVIGAIGLALARKPILGWASGLLGRTDATGDDAAS